MIALILETIDKCSQWKSMRHLAHLIGEDSAAKWNDMINYLYLLLGMSVGQSVSKACLNYDKLSKLTTVFGNRSTKV